ncbi:MAG TPA: hypothetical protein VFY15_07040, partial [Acidimicrobiia bacterium]|nr:hypothetical protein [Acidimicrobiia bacterium]
VVTMLAVLLALTVFAAPAALAGQNAIGAGVSSAPAGSVGPSISGDIYGNTSNPSGNGEGVLPSLAPGPWKCGDPLDCAGPTDPGGSMGDFVAPIASGGTASPDFAHGNDPDLDFSS